MADINEIKEKVMGTIGSVADLTKDVAAKAADKAKGMARIAKLSVEINGEKDIIKKAYLEIGKLYYETHKGDPEGFFTQLCEEISIAADNINEKENEIAEIKSALSEKPEESVEVEFEEVVECQCGCREHSPQDEETEDESSEEPDSENDECHCGCAENSKFNAEKLVSEIKDKVSDVVSDVLSSMPDKAAEVKDKVSDALSGMPDKASEIKDRIVVAAGEVAGAVRGVINDMTDKKDDNSDS